MECTSVPTCRAAKQVPQGGRDETLCRSRGEALRCLTEHWGCLTTKPAQDARRSSPKGRPGERPGDRSARTDSPNRPRRCATKGGRDNRREAQPPCQARHGGSRRNLGNRLACKTGDFLQNGLCLFPGGGGLSQGLKGARGELLPRPAGSIVPDKL